MSRAATHDKTQGTGRTYVLLHGFCLDHTIWEKVAAQLEGNIQLVMPDLPGFGKSAPLNEVYTINALGKWLHNWITEQGINNFVLLGHSLGGYVALEYARRFEDNLAGFGLIHSHCYGDSDEKKLERQKVERFVASHGSVPYLKESIPNLFHENFKIQKADIVASIVHHNRFIDPDVIIHYLQAMRLRSNQEETLEKIQVPSLFVMGADDKLTPLSWNLKQCIYPELSTIKIIDQTAHMGMIENPDQVADAIMELEELVGYREASVAEA